MTDGDIVERFQEAVGGIGRITGPRRYPSMKEHHKDVWEWTLYGKNCISIVKEMLPYLGFRRRVKAIELLEWYGQHEREVAED